MGLCGRMEGGDQCPASGERRYMNTVCCRRPPVPVPDPARTAAALRDRPDYPRARTREYGTATTDPPRLRADGVTPWPVEPKPDKGDRK